MGITEGNLRPHSRLAASYGHRCDHLGVTQLAFKSHTGASYEPRYPIVDSVERIRGGGPSKYSRPHLSDLPRCDWGRQVVTAIVQTAKRGAALEDAMIVGFVDPEGKEADHDELVHVDVVYVSNLGLLETASSQAFPQSSLFIAEGGSEEECIAIAWRERLPCHKSLDQSTDDSAPSQSESSCSSNGDAPAVDTVYKGLDGCFDGVVCSNQIQNSACSLCFGDCFDGEKAGLGCSLATSFPDNEDGFVTSSGPTSSMTMIKTLLLQIANNLPLTLRAKTGQVGPRIRGSFWHDVRYKEWWCTFVEKCTCPRQVAQAFVVFLSIIEKEKLPLWWRSASAGWSKAFVLMCQPTCSGLLLHLYVLDAAIGEFVQSSRDGNDVGAS